MTMTLACDDIGDGPALVLLHAGVADRRMWSEQLQPLADAGFRVLAPDLPGFGDSPPQPGIGWWDAVLTTLGARDVHEATLVGNSFGGAVALRVAALAPVLMAALVLVSCPAPGMDPSPRLQAAWEAEEEAIERGDLDEATRAVVDAWTLPDAAPELRELVATMQRRAFELQTEAGEEPTDPIGEDVEALAAFTCPALVLAGERDMSDFVEGARALAAALPASGEAVLVRGAGHLAPLERPEEFRRLLLDFLGGLG